jgi:hypothetical protein
MKRSSLHLTTRAIISSEAQRAGAALIISLALLATLSARQLPRITAKERAEAERAYEHARQVYRRILAESSGN